MDTTTQTRELILGFIEAIWNHGRFDRLDEFLHPDFTDRSLPPSFSTGQDGLVKWITSTSESFEHHTAIEALAAENDTCIVKIRMDLAHIGNWRGIGATGKTVSVVGYRCFKTKDHKIIEHTGLIDGNAVENQLKDIAYGCKTQQ